MDLVLRALAVYAVVFLFTRILGRRELSNLQPFDLILLVVIGDLIQQGVTQNDLSVTGVLIVLATLGVAQVFTSYMSYRFPRTRRILNGEPVILVDNGKILENNMRRERLTHVDLTEAARRSEIDNLDAVRWAVLETTGDITFIKRQ